MRNQIYGRVLDRKSKITFICFILFHLSCLLVFFVGVSPIALLVAFVLYSIRCFGVCAGYHRYFSHRAFKTGRVFQCLLSLWGSMACQGRMLWWAGHHPRHHHKSDQPGDLHSPVQYSFFRAHMSWTWKEGSYTSEESKAWSLKKFPELKWVENYYSFNLIVQPLLLYMLGEWINHYWPSAGTNGYQMIIWGFSISIVVLWHSLFCLNSVCHTFGSAPYETNDRSKNNFIVAILTMGDGWHNNHHKYMNSARHGFHFWQIDMVYIILKILEKLKIVWDVKEVPKEAYE